MVGSLWSAVFRLRSAVFGLLCLLLLAACHQDMYEQDRYQYQEPSEFFNDGRSARPLPAGSVQYLQDESDSFFYTGQVGGEFVTEFPFPITAVVLDEGQRGYNDFCAPCHAVTGTGEGFIALRGDFAVPSLYEQRLIDAPEGYIFQVITNGVGRMYGYGTRIQEADRWAIIAYVRALQLSRTATVDDVPADVLAELEGE